MELDLEDVINYAEEYEHKYFDKIEEGLPKGTINFRTKQIKYNPIYNDEGETLCHEVMHHHYRNVYGFDLPEFFVEQEGKRLYDMHKEDIDMYVRTKLQWDTEKERRYENEKHNM